MNKDMLAALPQGTLGFAQSAGVKITTNSRFVMLQLDVAMQPDTPATAVQVAMSSELAMQILEILQQMKAAYHLPSASADQIQRSELEPADADADADVDTKDSAAAEGSGAA